jgi:hypothetical protein
MTVDPCYARVLVNAWIYPSGAASLYKRASGSFETGLIGGPRIPPNCTHAVACSSNLPVKCPCQNFDSETSRHFAINTSVRAIAQMKPSSSLATAVTAWLAGLPRASSFLSRECSLC